MVFLTALVLLLLGRKVARIPSLVRPVIVRPEEAGFLWLAGQVLAHGPPRAVHRLLRETVQALSTP